MELVYTADTTSSQSHRAQALILLLLSGRHGTDYRKIWQCIADRLSNAHMLENYTACCTTVCLKIVPMFNENVDQY